MTLNLDQSNKFIIDLLKKDTPFTILRLGYGPETYMLYDYLTSKSKETYINSINIDMNELYKICGIYSKTNNILSFVKFWNTTWNSLKYSDSLASMNYDERITHIEKTFAEFNSIPQITAKVIEPFYVCEANIIPWTRHLIGKRVLIISPFVESFQKQLANKFQIFKDEKKKIFDDDQDFIFYKTYQTQAHDYIHNDWEETYQHMAHDIAKLDFDVALVSCGGYGIPLCNFIKTNMHKSAIYTGAGLQLLFGVFGYRWQVRDDWKKRIQENDIKFIHPDEKETIKNYKSIENGAYW